MNHLSLELWRCVVPLNDSDLALEKIVQLLSLDSICFQLKADSLPDNSENRIIFPAAGGVLVYQLKSDSVKDKEILEESVKVFCVVQERFRERKELIQHREAAEAEKQAALTRLGRKEIGNEMIGRDSGLQHVLERVKQVAGSDLPVLIIGETGTGKELIARKIHQYSKRSQNPFQRVNCGAIPPELIDSQLFGHERGSFTGATDQRKGWFERADGGTLFLDEIGELPLAAQVRLLRILQDGHFERVGGQKSLTCNVRIVAATNRDLVQMVAEEKFRADLWYRIAVFPIRIPPLRERKEDISRLAEHFAAKAAIRFGLPTVHPNSEDLQQLSTYSWPGNIREFGSVIDRAAILGNGSKLDIAAALGSSEKLSTTSPVSTDHKQDKESFESDSETTFDELVRQNIESVLKTTLGRVNGPFGAAKILGLNPNTLRSKMRKLGIDPGKFKNG